MIEIQLLGPTAVRVSNGGHRIELPAKPRRILEMLALDVGLPVTKDRLAEGIWDGRPPTAYVGTLESYVCVLRRRLGINRGRSSALATTPSGYVLDPEQVHVDLSDVRSELAGSVAAEGAARVASAERLLGHPFDRLLVTEPYAQWANEAREELGRQVTDCFTAAAAAANQLGEPVRAIRLADAAVRLGDVRETTWMELMQALWRSGRNSDALRAYGRLRRVLAEELGVTPGRDAEALYLQILRDDRESDRGHDHQEVWALVRLLKQAIAGLPRLDVLGEEPELRAVADLLTRQAV
jgi:DNA-binding SARP family transcriptional activator